MPTGCTEEGLLRVPREYRSIAWVPCPRVMWTTAECMYVAQVLVPPRPFIAGIYSMQVEVLFMSCSAVASNRRTFFCSYECRGIHDRDAQLFA